MVSLPGEVIPGHKGKTDFLKKKTLLKKLPYLQHLPKTIRVRNKTSNENVRQMSDAEHNSKVPGT